MTAEHRSNLNFTKFVRSAIAVLFLVCFTSGFRVSCRRSDDTATYDLTSNPHGVWVRIFNGKTLDGWRLDEFNLPGAIKVKDKSLLFREGSPYTALSWTGKFPTDNYEFEVSAMRLSGGDIFCGILFPIDTTYVSMVLGGWGNSVVGLSSIDYLDASSNETTLLRSFANNQWYHVRLRVTREKIQAWIDDKEVINLRRRSRMISPYPGLELLAPFGIFTWQTGAAMRDLQIRLLDQDR